MSHPAKPLRQLIVESYSEADTARFAAALARCVLPGTTIALNGTLGAGKTRIVQAFAEACGVSAQAVVSPTYVICQEYAGDRFRLYHMDVYRLNAEEEFLELGSDEILGGDGVQLIEWAERVKSCLPTERLELQIDVTGENQRTLRLTALGESYNPVIECLRASVPAEQLRSGKR